LNDFGFGAGRFPLPASRLEMGDGIFARKGQSAIF
jgi:hypothetical protein